MYITGDVIDVDFTTRTFDTGVGTNADSLPTGTLVINGTDNGATVTVTNKSTGIYHASVTLPAVTDGDVIQIRIAATVDTVTDNGIVWDGVGTSKLVVTLNDFDPANDDVANVTLVDTVTTNTDKITASEIRTAIGLSTANLDTQLAALPTQAEITGGAYPLDTDANGRMRVVDGTGVGELSITSGFLDWNSAWDAEVQSEAADALAAYNAVATTDLPTNFNSLSVSSSGQVTEAGTVTGTVSSATIGSVTTNITGYTDDSFVDLVLTVTSGSGYGQTVPISAYNGTTGVFTLSEGLATAPVNGDTVQVKPKHTHTISQISVGVWSENLAGYTTGGTAGDYVRTANDKLNTIDGIVDQILLDIAALPSQEDITGGGYALDTDANGRVRIVDGTGIGELDTDSGTVLLRAATEAQIDAIEGDTNELQTDDIPGLIAALNNVSTSDINAQVVDALNVDTYAEPGQGTPGDTISLASKINYLYKAWRNKKEQTSGVMSLYNSAGTVVDQKSSNSDDGTTLTVGTITTGP